MKENCPRCNQPIFEFSEVCQICGCELEGTAFNSYPNGHFYEEESNQSKDTKSSEVYNEFKIESITDGRISNVDTPVIITVLSLIRTKGVESKKTYIFKSNSLWAKEILKAKKINDIVFLDIDDNDFIIQSGFINEIMTDLYYQRDILENDLFDRTEVYNDIVECTYKCGLDMYFYYIFEFIVRYEYREKNRTIPSLDELHNFYMTVIKDILLKGCGYRDNDNYHFYNYSFGEYYQNYLDECIIFKDVILDYVNCDNQLQKRLKIGETENPFFHPNAIRFFQESILFGYELAKERIEEYLYSKDYFNYRVEKFNGKEILIVNLTPYGSIHRNLLINMIDEKIFVDFYNQSLAKLGCVKYNHPKVIYTVEDHYFGYIIRQYSWQNEFMLQRIKRPHTSSILYAAQVNYHQISKTMIR